MRHRALLASSFFGKAGNLLNEGREGAMQQCESPGYASPLCGSSCPWDAHFLGIRLSSYTCLCSYILSPRSLLSLLKLQRNELDLLWWGVWHTKIFLRKKSRTFVLNDSAASWEVIQDETNTYNSIYWTALSISLVVLNSRLNTGEK